MRIKKHLIWLSPALLCACETSTLDFALDPASFSEAQVERPPAVVEFEPQVTPLPLPGQLKPIVEKTAAPSLKPYERIDKANADAKDFLIILVGSDRSEDAQRAYMKKSEMPFLAVPFTAEGVRKIKQAYAGGGIPNLVILDEQGVALKGSYETDGKYTPKNRNSYIGPFAVLEHFAKQHAEAVKKAGTGAA